MTLVNWGKYCKNDESCLQGTTLALHMALGGSDADADFFNRFLHVFLRDIPLYTSPSGRRH